MARCPEMCLSGLQVPPERDPERGLVPPQGRRGSYLRRALGGTRRRRLWDLGGRSHPLLSLGLEAATSHPSLRGPLLPVHSRDCPTIAGRRHRIPRRRTRLRVKMMMTEIRLSRSMEVEGNTCSTNAE